MPYEDMLGEIDVSVLRAADSLPDLLADLTAGQEVDPGKLAFARRATATVATIADLLAIAANLYYGKDGGEYSRPCFLHYRDLGRIIVALCPEHCNGPVPEELIEDVVSPSRSREREVLDYLRKMFGHKREIRCAVCSMQIARVNDGLLRRPPVGEGPLRNGVLLTFRLCNHEALRRNKLTNYSTTTTFSSVDLTLRSPDLLVRSKTAISAVGRPCVTFVTCRSPEDALMLSSKLLNSLRPVFPVKC